MAAPKRLARTAGFLSDLVAATCFLLTAIALHGLLKHVHGLAAAAMVTLNAVGAAIGGLNLLNQYTALTIAAGGDYARTFGEAGADRLAMLYVDAHHNGGNIAFVFFALWLVPLGYLVIRSGYFPKVLGVLLIVGCFGSLAGVFTDFLAPDAGEGIVMFFGAVGGLFGAGVRGLAAGEGRARPGYARGARFHRLEAPTPVEGDSG